MSRLLISFKGAIAILLLALSFATTARAQELKRPEFVGLRVGFAGHYKAGHWTPVEVTLHGGSKAAVARVRASATDGDGLNCSYDAPGPCQLLPDADTTVLLYVRFGHKAGSLELELLGEAGTLASKTYESYAFSASDQLPDAIPAGRRLIVLVGKSSSGLAKAVPNTEGDAATSSVATVNSLSEMPTRWEGYEGVNIVVISTSRADVLETITADNVRIAALDQWVHLGGTLVLCAGSNAEEALHSTSPLAKFVPGQFDKSVPSSAGAWEAYAKSGNPMPPPKQGDKVELPTARIVKVQGRVEAHDADLPLVMRSPRGLGQVVFVATDLDRGPIRNWSDLPLLLAAILDLPLTEKTDTTNVQAQNFGSTDLAGQLRSGLDLPRDVHLVPFFVVALLVVLYVLLIGPGDYFLLRRLGRGMQWTWITFPAIVVVFSVSAYFAAYWLKGDQLRVSQVDLVDIDADGTARGASWFSIFSPRGESFDLSMRPRLPDGQTPQQAEVSLAWFGKAGDGFNGMYGRDTTNSASLFSQGYSIAPALDAISAAPIPVWASKCFTQRWLGRAGDLGIEASLKEDDKQLSGTITNRLKSGDPQLKNGITLSRCYLVYDNWVYDIGTLEPGKPVEFGATKIHKVSLKTFLGGQSPDDANQRGADSDNGFYDRSSRDPAYALQHMMFYDAAGGRKQAGGLANDYQGFTDLSGLIEAGCAILVAMPPQDGSCRGGDLLRGPMPKGGEPDVRQPLGSTLDRHTIFYRFILPVTSIRPEAAN